MITTEAPTCFATINHLNGQITLHGNLDHTIDSKGELKNLFKNIMESGRKEFKIIAHELKVTFEGLMLWIEEVCKHLGEFVFTYEHSPLAVELNGHKKYTHPKSRFAFC